MRFGPFLVAVLYAATPLTVAASEVPCANSAFVVLDETEADQQGICAAARDALAFLESIGLKLHGNVDIKLIDRFKGNASNHAIGQYDARSREISLLGYDAALNASQERPAFRITMSRELWYSYVSHELAHAAAIRYFAPGVRTLTASEYIAAVAQLATLSQATRERILQNHRDVEAFDDADAISQVYYLMSPCNFAVKAYLHYLKPENGPRFIQHMMQRGLPN